MLNFGGWTREREGGVRRIMMPGRGLWEIIVRVMRGSCLIFRKNESVCDAVANSEYYSLEVPMKVSSISGRIPERRHPLREPIRNAMGINYLIIDHIIQDMNQIYPFSSFISCPLPGLTTYRIFASKYPRMEN